MTDPRVLVLPVLLSACVVSNPYDGDTFDSLTTTGSQGPTETGSGDGDGDPATGDGDGDPTGDGDGDPTGDGDGDMPGLGETPNVLCEAAIVGLDAIVAETAGASFDAAAVEEAYVGTGLQQFVQLAGSTTGRVADGVLIDDAAILASIAAGEPLDLVDVEWRIYLAMHKFIRHEIADVSSTLPNPANDPALLYARWDAAYCYWDGALRPWAQQADALGLGDTIEADIDAGFAWGHASVEGQEPWAIDEWELPAAKQVVEKSSFAIFHRLITSWSETAATLDEPMAAAVAARSAYGAFQLIEDRMETKNTPGIQIVEDALMADDPGTIDPAEILRQLNIAFVKRTRKYTDFALPEVGGLMGTPEGYVGANEGATYSKLVEPYIAALDGFDQAAYRDSWATYIEAVRADELASAEAASAELTDWNCQLQDALGIPACTSSIDEQ